MALRAEITNDLDFGGLNDIMARHINKKLHKIGYFLAEYAKKNHRYNHRTGNLKRSTRFWVNKSISRVRLYISEQQAHYGKYVHEGHGTWKPDRFIDNAIKRNKDYIDREVAEAMRDATKEWNRKNRI